MKFSKRSKTENKAYSDVTKSPNDQALQLALKDKRCTLRKIIKAAKIQWVEKIANNLTDKSFKSSPKASWDAVKEIQKGFRGHHERTIITNFAKADGTLADNNKDNADVLEKHFDTVYNGAKISVDIDQILKEIKKRTTMTDLDEPPTMNELEKAIQLSNADKAPGPSGISPRAFHNLSKQGKEILLGIITEIYNGNQNPTEFHHASLKILHKKGAQSNPSNWRGITLKEASAKLLSAIINQRLLRVLETHGVENQYGALRGKGCRDGIFTLRAALETRRLHNKETWVIFADLIKAFDTANHELLFALLPQYGVPPKLTRIIRQLYTDMFVNLEYKKEKREIPYTLGVQQGDNMAPVLFLFLMQAFAETLEQNWKMWELTAPEYRYMNRGTKQQGYLFNQTASARGTAFQLFYLLFVDDGAFLFNSKEELSKGAEILRNHFYKFGLKMHIGKPNEPSKTEVMFFPPNLQNDIDTNSILSNIFPVTNGHIQMTNSFTYLGVNISPDLKDDNEIKKRIQKATSQLGALKSFFREKAIPVTTKYKVYMAIPICTLLWGSESWSLNEHNKRLLQVFHHKSIRWIFNISIIEVQDYKITNKAIRNLFCNIPDILDIIKARQMNWISSISKMTTQRLPRKLIASWIDEPRKRGRPQTTYRNSYADCIATLIPSISTSLPLKHWLNIAASTQWTQLQKQWWKTLTNNTVIGQTIL
jgi:Reverse transcriptase (RNA-dependent DNA polymerase)